MSGAAGVAGAGGRAGADRGTGVSETPVITFESTLMITLEDRERLARAVLGSADRYRAAKNRENS